MSRRKISELLLLAGISWAWVSSAPALTFTNVTVSAGVSYQQGPPNNPLMTPEVTAMTGGAAAGDYDGDGWVDLFVTRIDAPDLLFRNQGDGTFVDATTSAFGASPIDAPTNGAAWADVDNDGDLDLYVTTVGSNRHLLYVNNNGVFAESAVSRGAAIGGAGQTVYGTGVAFGDYDRDGYLDAFVAEWRPDHIVSPIRATLLHNLGSSQPGHFEDRTIAEGVTVEVPNIGGNVKSFSFSPRFTDLDGDREPDLAITGDFGTSRLFWNQGAGAGPRFSEDTAGAGVDTGSHDMGSAIGDVNGDGRLDWFITDIYFDGGGTGHPNGNRLFLNQGNRTFSDATDSAGVRNGDWGWGAALADFDNDRDLDLTHTNGFLDGTQFLNDPMRLWENDGTGVFSEVSAAATITETGQGRGLLTFDYDNDGDLDIFVVNNGEQPVLLRNDTNNANSFLRIKTVGTTSNRDGIGSHILVTPDLATPSEVMLREVSAGTHYLAQSEVTAHFGLGSSTTSVDEVLILWPSGFHQRVIDVPAGIALEVTETPGDYNADGVVDAADYTVWRDSQGATGQYLAADGDGNGVVDSADYLVWLQDFGKIAYTLPSASATSSTPEPSSIMLLASLIAGMSLRNRR